MTALAQPADTVMMSVMHDAMRRDFRRLRDALEQPTPPSPRRRTALADHVDFILGFLDIHHHSEDDKLWPRVRAKSPDLSSLLEDMERDHERIVERAVTLSTAVAPYRESGSDRARSRLLAALDGLLDVLLPHLDREEFELMPLVSARLTVGEWRAFEREARPQVPKTRLAEYLNWFFDGLDAERRRRVIRGLPTPLVWCCVAVFGPGYRRRASLRWDD